MTFFANHSFRWHSLAHCKRPSVWKLMFAVFICGTRLGAALDVASQSALPNRAGTGNSFVGAFSGDGQVIVFMSEANNLVTNDDFGPYLDIFARDLRSGTTTLLSVSISG